MDYFRLRAVDPERYSATPLPTWLAHRLVNMNRSSKILDFGCGFGQNLDRLAESGFSNLVGADVNEQALNHCRSKGLNVIDLSGGSHLLLEQPSRFDLVIATHVLEHIPKDEIIETLELLRRALVPGGVLIVAVPNAQAYTGAYWAYEDFTHNTLFTSGSLLYVLRAAGFEDPQIIDKFATDGLGKFARWIRSAASWLYYKKYCLATKLLASNTHIGSIDVFTYEVKAVAVA